MGSRVLIDTNILIDLVAGLPESLREIRRHEDRAISVISTIEFQVGLRAGEQDRAASMLLNFQQIELTAAVAEETVRVRREKRLKFPDAVLLATAIVDGRILITRNTRDFADGPYVHIPYIF